MNPTWIATFRQEAEALLATIEEGALQMSAGDAPPALIDDLFRAFHTLKGSGSMCGLKKMPAFTHHVESLLDQARSGVLPSSKNLTDLLLTCKDHIVLLLDAEQGMGTEPEGASERIIRALDAMNSDHVISATSSVPMQEPLESIDRCHASDQTLRHWKIYFQPSKDLLLTGGNPKLLLRDVAKLGCCVVTAHLEDLPQLDTIEPTLCYLSWTIDLQSTCDRDAILDVFLFAQDDGILKIEEQLRQPEAAYENRTELLTEHQTDSSSSLTTVPRPASDEVAKTIPKESSVRVPSERLDRLVNLVGELVMNHSRLATVSERLGIVELANLVEGIDRLLSELRNDVLSIRMLPMGSIFGRFRRVVHDLSAELGKEAELVTSGEDTELDKSILDQIGEPLVHLLRNSIDHGIETPEAREAAGKPRRGTVWLTAEHLGSEVVISIRDDGRGINREMVRTKAIERGFITPEAILNDKEICNLTLLPGFSTAQKVTSVSGRGVGMDAVKRQIDSLRGTLSIHSVEGKGTCTALGLPLTLAIIDGLVVEVGGQNFILPMTAVMENVELHHDERLRNNGRNVLAIRGVRIAYIDLRALFGMPSAKPGIEKIVIVKHEDHRVGFVVDRVLGTHQTVLQSLGPFFQYVDIISGSTIMGDGRVALIVDVAALVRKASRAAPESFANSHRNAGQDILELQAS